MKKSTKLILLTGILYFVCQVSRSDLSAVLVDLIADLGIGKEAISIAITAGYISYAAGMLINSLIADGMNPRGMICLAMFGCTLTHVGVRLFPVLPVIVVLWCVNGYLQSMIWPSVLRIIVANTSGDVRDRGMRIVSLFQHAGSISCYLIAPLGIALGGWRAVMLGSAAACLTCAFVWTFARFANNAAKVTVQSSTPPCPLDRQFFIRTNLLTFIVLSCLSGMIRDGLTTWAPVYYTEQFSLNATLSVLFTAFLPLCKILSYVILPLMQRLFDNSRRALTLLYAAICLAAVALLVMHRLVLVIPAILLMGLMICLNGCAGIYYLIQLPIKFTSYGRTASISGILDCMFYVGAALASYGFAAITERGGWTATLISWIVLPAAALLIVRVFGRFNDKVEAAPAALKQ